MARPKNDSNKSKETEKVPAKIGQEISLAQKTIEPVIKSGDYESHPKFNKFKKEI